MGDRKRGREVSARVLLVEDDISQRQILEESLRVEGFAVVSCGSVTETLACLQQDCFDALVVDLRIPDRDEQHFLQEISPYFEKIPAIVNTGVSSLATAKAALNLGVFTYVEKTRDAHELIRKVHQALESRSCCDSQTLEQALLNIFNLSLDLICIIDIQKLTFGRINPACERILGYMEAELLEHPFFNLIHPEDVERTQAMIDEKLKQGNVVDNFKNRCRCKDGSYRWLSWAFQPHLGLGLAYAIAHDITQRRQVEEALMKSEEKFRLIAENGLENIWQLDLNGHLTYASSPMQRIFGYSPQEVLGLRFDTFLAESEIERAAHAFAQAVSGLDHQLVELTGKSKEGSLIPIEVDVTPIIQNDVIVGVQGIARDITKRKLAEEDLRKASRALRALNDCNQAMMHATEESDLLHEICRIVVEAGGYHLVWVGFADRDKSKTVRPMAQAGFEDGYLETVNITWADTERGHGPTGTAIRTGVPSVCQNILSDPEYALWRSEAIKRGYKSSVSLPLITDGETVGALNIYAVEPHAFDVQELALLTELADDLTHGITVIRNRAERKRTEEQMARTSATLDGINRVLRETLTCKSEDELGRVCLAMAEELTGSKFGLIGELNKKGLFDTIAISNPGWDACKMPGSKAVRVIKDMPIRGVDRATIRDGKSRIVNDLTSHPDHLEPPEGHPDVTSFLGVPLKHDGKTIGMIGLSNKKSGYTPDDQEVIEKLSVAFVEALTRKRAEDQLLTQQKQLKALASELTLTEERLKRTVATELHDRISQSLAVSNMSLISLQDSINDPSLQETLANITESLTETLNESRSLTSRLSYPVLNVLGLPKATEQWLNDEIGTKYDLQTHFSDDGLDKPLDEDVKAVLFRSIREVLNNIVKHAQARHVAVAIQRDEHDAVVKVTDDGIGFDAQETMAKSCGFGLLSVQESLERLNGRMETESHEGAGCKITLRVPLRVTEAVIDSQEGEQHSSRDHTENG